MKETKRSFELLDNIVTKYDEFAKRISDSYAVYANQIVEEFRNDAGNLLEGKPNITVGKDCADKFINLKENGNNIYNTDMQSLQLTQIYESFNQKSNKLRDNLNNLNHFVDSIKTFNDQFEFVNQHKIGSCSKSDLEITSIGEKDVVTSSPVDSIEQSENARRKNDMNADSTICEPITWS